MVSNFVGSTKNVPIGYCTVWDFGGCRKIPSKTTKGVGLKHMLSYGLHRDQFAMQLEHWRQKKPFPGFAKWRGVGGVKIQK